MARLTTSEILGAVALGKRSSQPKELPEVKITATKLTKGDPSYNIGGKQVSHATILAAVPQAQRASVDKYLTTFRVKQGGNETPVTKGTSVMSDNYNIQASGTKNDTWDMINSIAKGVK